jgi:O-antigen/teichoic acid export membrane protein
MASEDHPTALAELESDLLDTPQAGPAAIRGSALRTAGYVVGVALSIVSVPLLIRHLGVVEYGRYVTVVSLVTIVQGITDVGLGQIGVREYSTRASAQRAQLMRNLLGVRFVLTAVGVLLATAFSGIAGYPDAVVWGTLLAGGAMVLTVLQGTFAVPLASQLRLGWVTALELLRQVLSVAGIVVLILAGAKLIGFFAVMVPVALVVLVATIVVVRGTMPLRPSFDRGEWLLLMRAVLPFAAAVVIASLYLRITVVLLSLLSTPLQTGYYASSFAVISVLIAIPALTVGSTLPVLARAARDDRERLAYVVERLVDVTLIAGVGIGVMLALGAEFVVRVLGSGHPAVVLLQIEAVAIVTQFVGSAWQYGLLALHRHRSLLIISAAGLLVSVVLTLVLAPSLQARGAAIAFSGAEVVVASLSFAFLHVARPDVRFSLRVPARVLLAAAIACAVLVLPGLGSLADALLGGALFVLVLALTGAIPEELIEMLPGRSALRS